MRWITWTPRQKNTINFYFFQSRFLWFDVHFLAVLCFYFILPCFLFFSGQDPVLTQLHNLIIQTHKHLFHFRIFMKVSEIPFLKFCLIRHALQVLAEFHLIVRQLSIPHCRGHISWGCVGQYVAHLEIFFFQICPSFFVLFP